MSNLNFLTTLEAGELVMSESVRAFSLISRDSLINRIIVWQSSLGSGVAALVIS